MLPEASQKELDALNKEFKYGIRGDILPIHPPKSNAESVYFQLTTHEGLLVHVELSNGGFRIIHAETDNADAAPLLAIALESMKWPGNDEDDTTHIYEGMEGLLMTISPKFRELFHERLYAKLADLAAQQAES